MSRGFTTKVLFDQAQQGLRTAQAQVDDAKAQLEIAEDRVSYTQLKANVAGTITARGAESGGGRAAWANGFPSRSQGRLGRRF